MYHIKDGGLVLQVGLNPQCVFSSHLDTVEDEDGTNELEEQDGILRVKGGGILGADDGAGVYLMTKMIEAKVPGLYFFTMDEEVMSDGGMNLLRDEIGGQRFAIAFDRRGRDSVCISQMHQKLASTEFGMQLCNYFGFKLDRGVYTDNFRLKGRVDEIVNLSVGYEREHSAYEALDTNFLNAMIRKCIEFDWDGLQGEGPLYEMAMKLDDELQWFH